MEEFAPKEMAFSEQYENSIKNAYKCVRDNAAKSQLTVSKTEARSKDAVDFDFDTELRRTRRYDVLARPRYTYKTLQKDDKKMAGEPTNLSSDDEDDAADLRASSAYIARRPFTAYDRETTGIGNRRYYSRQDDGEDPDYFDYDLNHSIDLFRKPKPVSSGTTSYFNSRSVGANPQLWESKDFKELCNFKSNRLLSTQLYSDRTKKLLDDDSLETAAEGDTVVKAQSNAANTEVDINKGLLAAAIRTPTYWTRRFESLTNLK